MTNQNRSADIFQTHTDLLVIINLWLSLSRLPPLTSQMPPLPEPCSDRGFFLLKGSFSFPLWLKGVQMIVGGFFYLFSLY